VFESDNVSSQARQRVQPQKAAFKEMHLEVTREDRQWWCRCGSPFQTWAVAMFWYSLNHVTVGALKNINWYVNQYSPSEPLDTN